LMVAGIVSVVATTLIVETIVPTASMRTIIPDDCSALGGCNIWEEACQRGDVAVPLGVGYSDEVPACLGGVCYGVGLRWVWVAFPYPWKYQRKLG
jgi:hypothetical protein